MRAGIAFTNSPAAFAAGQHLVKQAAAQLKGEPITVLLLFCTAATDYVRLLDGARSCSPTTTHILGGSAVGIITQDQIAITGYPAVTLALSSATSHTQFISAVADNLLHKPYLAGQHLASQLNMQLPSLLSPALLLLFYDSVRYPGNAKQPAVLTPSPPLLSGLTHTFNHAVPIAGAGLLADMQFGPTKQFYQHKVASQLATTLLIAGAVKPYICAMHGCTPMSEQRFTITSIHQQFLYQLNGQPVTTLLDTISGSQQWRTQRPVTRLALGMQQAPITTHYSTSYITRLINGVLPNDEGIILFEPDFVEGAQIQIMQRDMASILKATDEQTKKVLKQIADDKQEPIVALYFDCAGRISNNQQEARLVQQHMQRANIPLLGIFTGVEIAPIGEHSSSLDWSGVLIILTQAQPAT